MDSGQSINWSEQKSELFLNPRLSSADRADLEAIYKKNMKPRHIFVASSGSSQKAGESLKLIALSYDAFFASAAAVNRHLAATPMDVWLQPLPRFHVGGLSIYARAYLSNSQVVDFPQWPDPQTNDLFSRICENEKVTLTSLVPTQLFDLVEAKVKSPKSLRAVVIGGGKLEDSLYVRARQLGWPVLPSYGMTELCSQIATANLNSLDGGHKNLEILSHIQTRIDGDGFLEVRSPALLTGFGQWIQGELCWTDVPQGSWFKTSDLVEIQGPYLIPAGRKHQFIKVLGEGVDLSQIQEKFDRLCSGSDQNLLKLYQISSSEDPRQGSLVTLQVLNSLSIADWEKIQFQVSEWNRRSNPVERIQKVDRVETLNWKRASLNSNKDHP